MLTLTSCPDCNAPAEITDRFTLASTEGPVAHVAVSCLAGHHYRMPADKLPQPPAPAPRRLRSLRTHRFQLCVHCQVNPAGFWVSTHASTVTRRPWCLSCCEHLDPAACHITPFVPLSFLPPRPRPGSAPAGGIDTATSHPQNGLKISPLDH